MMPISGTSRLIARGRAADEIVFVQRFVALGIAQRRVGIGKEGERRNAELGGGLGLAHRDIDRKALDSGQRADGLRPVIALDEKIGQMRSLMVSSCSRTRRRDHSALRFRRSRTGRSSPVASGLVSVFGRGGADIFRLLGKFPICAALLARRCTAERISSARVGTLLPRALTPPRPARLIGRL